MGYYKYIWGALDVYHSWFLSNARGDIGGVPPYFNRHDLLSGLLECHYGKAA